MTRPIPAWMTPGAQAAVVRRHGYGRTQDSIVVRGITIRNVGKRFVTIDPSESGVKWLDGVRFDHHYGNGGTDDQLVNNSRGGGGYSSTTLTLCSPDDPDLVEVETEARSNQLRRNLGTAMSKCDTGSLLDVRRVADAAKAVLTFEANR